MPARMSFDRRSGMVQKQKTSARTAAATSAASVPARAFGNFAAAASSRAALTSHTPATSKRGFAWKAAAWCMPRLPMPATTTLYFAIAAP